MTTTQWIVLGITLWAVFVLIIWAIVHGGSMGEDDPTEYDDEALKSFHRETYDRWRDNRVHVPHVQD